VLGATTSRAHTAVKIEPQYSAGPVVWVKDASRAVGVVASLLSEALRGDYLQGMEARYAAARQRFANKGKSKELIPLAQARANAFRPDWTAYQPPRPAMGGLRACCVWMRKVSSL
jgi:5-methyltetrahydrofolate--homocysteine methyltransferase